MLKHIAIFVLGLTSPILVHIPQTILGFILPSQRDGVMNGLINSVPSNVIGLVFFIAAAIYLYFTHRKTKDNKKDNKKELTDAINRLINEMRQDRDERNKSK